MRCFRSAWFALASLMLIVFVGCGDDDSFGPISPGGGSGGGFTPADIQGVWYSSPDPTDWPVASCDMGSSFQPCLAARADFVQSGTDVTGSFQCYENGDFASLTGAFSTATDGNFQVTLCDGTGCWDVTYSFTVEGDGSLSLRMEGAVSVTSGELCTSTGRGISYPEATTVPVVAGIYDYVLLEIPGDCPTCGNATTHTVYILQDEGNLVITIPDSNNGVTIYGAQIDATGAGGYFAFSVESPPCQPYLDIGTITFQGGGFVALGQAGCITCQCQYAGTGFRR